MNQHTIADKQVIPAQLIFFIVASFFGFSGDLLPGEYKLILYKLADALFITGCIILGDDDGPERLGPACIWFYRSFHCVGGVLPGQGFQGP